MSKRIALYCGPSRPQCKASADLPVLQRPPSKSVAWAGQIVFACGLFAMVLISAGPIGLGIAVAGAVALTGALLVVAAPSMQRSAREQFPTTALLTTIGSARHLGEASAPGYIGLSELGVRFVSRDPKRRAANLSIQWGNVRSVYTFSKFGYATGMWIESGSDEWAQLILGCRSRKVNAALSSVPGIVRTQPEPDCTSGAGANEVAG